MKTVFEYSISLAASQTIRVPADISILSLQMTRDTIQMWALVDATSIIRPLEILIFGTGFTIVNSEDLTYLGTVQPPIGMMVWHAFAKNDRGYARITKL